MQDYWLKQTTDKPLFDDLMWSKPENKSHAGKLLIVGGSTNGFAHTVSCYSEVTKAGAGTVRVFIPESTKKLIGSHLEDIAYGAATTSGGFAQAALSELLELSTWADTVLISGELGNNSETIILFEKFLNKYTGPLIIAGDGFEFMTTFADQLVKRASVTFVLNLAHLQKLFTLTSQVKPVTSATTLVNLIEMLSEMTKSNPANLILEFEKFIIVASGGFISTTTLVKDSDIQIIVAANAAVWYMQNPNKAFEALSCAAVTSQHRN